MVSIVIILTIVTTLPDDNSSITLWVTTVALILHLLVFNVGFGCLGFPVAAELMPETLRSRGLSIITFAAGVFGFLNSKSYLDLKSLIGTGGTFLSYGVINVAASIFIHFFIPDLKTVS